MYTHLLKKYSIDLTMILFQQWPSCGIANMRVSQYGCFEDFVVGKYYLMMGEYQRNQVIRLSNIY